jgi:hypothetical protein
MAEPKTRRTNASVAAFLGRIEDPDRRRDCRTVAAMMRRATGESPKMWGTAIVGFGTQPLKYASGRTLDWPQVAFSPRKGDLTLYLGPPDANADLLKRLGKHKTSKACLYIKRLSDVDPAILEALIRRTIAYQARPGEQRR